MGLSGILPVFTGVQRPQATGFAQRPLFSGGGDSVLFSANASKARKKKIAELCLGLGIPAPGSMNSYNLINQALTAPSAAGGNRLESNQRLEFLGDGVLYAVIREYLLMEFPDLNEGALTQLNSVLSCNRALTVMGDRMGLQPYILYTHDVEKYPKSRESMVADAVEALAGALYLARDGHTRDVKAAVVPQLQRLVSEIPIEKLTLPEFDTATLARETWPLASDKRKKGK